MSIKKKIGLVLFGLFFCLVLLEIGMRISGLLISSLQEYRNYISIQQRGQYRILCLGESTTMWGGRDSYPSQLEEILNSMNLGVRFSVINKGRAGTNTAFILAELEDNLKKYSPDMVITMMGINDESDEFGVTYKDTPKKSTLFFKSFRLYKLATLLRSRIINKAQEMGLHIPHEANVSLEEQLYSPLFYIEQKEYLENFIEKGPAAYQEYSSFQKSLMEQGGRNGAEGKLKKTIQMMPDNPWAYLGLGRYYWHQGRFGEAQEMFKKAIEAGPGNEWVYLEIAKGYTDAKEDYERVEQIFKKIIEISPQSAWGYTGLGWYHLKRNEYDKAEALIRKAATLDPKNVVVYLLLADCYCNRGDYEKAEAVFKEALEIKPDNRRTYIELGKYYWGQKAYKKAEDILNKATQLSLGNDIVYGMLANCYRRQGKIGLAEEYLRRGNRLRLGSYNPITRHNYWRLKESVTQKGMKLVCVQYPVRSVEPLKKLFDSTDTVIFVDNEKVFREALQQGQYSDYFVNMFAGDFGHCTRRGNRLLAANIAKAIRKECFKKYEGIPH